jgi:hypothetical protein
MAGQPFWALAGLLLALAGGAVIAWLDGSLKRYPGTVATLFCGPMILSGCVWSLQGVNILPGSFMTGHIIWTIYGIPLALVGLILVVWVNRRAA